MGLCMRESQMFSRCFTLCLNFLLKEFTVMNKPLHNSCSCPHLWNETELGARDFFFVCKCPWTSSNLLSPSPRDAFNHLSWCFSSKTGFAVQVQEVTVCTVVLLRHKFGVSPNPLKITLFQYIDLSIMQSLNYTEIIRDQILWPQQLPSIHLLT